VQLVPQVRRVESREQQDGGEVQGAGAEVGAVGEPEGRPDEHDDAVQRRDPQADGDGLPRDRRPGVGADRAFESEERVEAGLRDEGVAGRRRRAVWVCGAEAVAAEGLVVGRAVPAGVGRQVGGPGVRDERAERPVGGRLADVVVADGAHVVQEPSVAQARVVPRQLPRQAPVAGPSVAVAAQAVGAPPGPPRADPTGGRGLHQAVVAPAALLREQRPDPVRQGERPGLALGEPARPGERGEHLGRHPEDEPGGRAALLVPQADPGGHRVRGPVLTFREPEDVAGEALTLERVQAASQRPGSGAHLGGQDAAPRPRRSCSTVLVRLPGRGAAVGSGWTAGTSGTSPASAMRPSSAL